MFCKGAAASLIARKVLMFLRSLPVSRKKIGGMEILRYSTLMISQHLDIFDSKLLSPEPSGSQILVDHFERNEVRL